MTNKKAPVISDCSLPAPFVGVFSEHSSRTVGFGGTKRKEKVTSYWYVERTEDGETFIQPVNTNFAPTGKKRRIACEDVLRRFHPEPGVYTGKVLPRIREIEASVDRGDRHRNKGELYSAEFEYDGALRVDEDHIKANFGLGLTFLERGETQKAHRTFEKIVKLDEAFQEEHKHLFNEFGIKLRENGMYDQAVEYYTRALELCDWDDHLLFNIARAFFEKENLDSSYDFLNKALEVNPDLSEAKRLKSYLLKRNPGLAAVEEAKEFAAISLEGPSSSGKADLDIDF